MVINVGSSLENVLYVPRSIFLGVTFWAWGKNDFSCREIRVEI